MEFMEGGTLSQALKAWSFKEPQIAYFAREVLRGAVTCPYFIFVLVLTILLSSGLKVLHASNLAHRDIKPHNIMLDVDGFVKLSTDLALFPRANALVLIARSCLS